MESLKIIEGLGADGNWCKLKIVASPPPLSLTVIGKHGKYRKAPPEHATSQNNRRFRPRRGGAGAVHQLRP